MQTLALATLAPSFLFFACSNNDGNGIPPVCEPNSDEASFVIGPEIGRARRPRHYPQGPYCRNINYQQLELRLSRVGQH